MVQLPSNFLNCKVFCLFLDRSDFRSFMPLENCKKKNVWPTFKMAIIPVRKFCKYTSCRYACTLQFARTLHYTLDTYLSKYKSKQKEFGRHFCPLEIPTKEDLEIHSISGKINCSCQSSQFFLKSLNYSFLPFGGLN